MGTPRGFGSAIPRKSERERDLLFSWHHKNLDAGGRASVYVNSTLLDSDLEDSTFPLFGEPSPECEMAGRSSPINITTPSRTTPTSPRHLQASNLTSALQSTTGNEIRSSSAMNMVYGQGKGAGGARHDSVGSGLGPHYGSGALPISMSGSHRGQPRRESIAGSLVGGMSWGGVSVGSWIRDEYVSHSLWFRLQFRLSLGNLPV